MIRRAALHDVWIVVLQININKMSRSIKKYEKKAIFSIGE